MSWKAVALNAHIPPISVEASLEHVDRCSINDCLRKLKFQSRTDLCLSGINSPTHFVSHVLIYLLLTRPLSRRLAPPPPAGIVWRRRQPKNRRRAAEPAEIIGRRRHFYGAPRLVVISRQVNNDIIIAAVMTVCYGT